MSRKLKIAAVQMDAAPAPVAARLVRAADLIAEATSAGAQLVVLPEVFNTGYEYTDANYALAERLDGVTVTWMKQQAAAQKVHIAGTMMLLDEEDVYNTALLVAPDGRVWRYDKQYPFGWERAYFREGKRITVADTDLGKLGMMICWDAAHNELWERYAGKVDALVVMSCPPALHDVDLMFPDGLRVNIREIMGIYEGFDSQDTPVFGKDLDSRAAWLGVPVVHTTGAGTFRTHIPQPTISLAGFLAMRPDLWERILQANEVQLEAGYPHETKVLNAQGKVVARVTDNGDGFTIGEIDLADEAPQPQAAQPKTTLPLALFGVIDVLTTAITTSSYRRGLRRQWGARMAPVDNSTKVWGGVAALSLAVGWLFGMVFSRRARRPR